MKVTVTTKVTIDAAPKDIFRYLAEPKLHYLWNPPLRSVSTDKRLKQGAVYTSTSMMLGVRIENDNRVTQFKLDRLLEIQSHGGTLEYCAEYHLVPAAKTKATMVRCDLSVLATGKAFAFAKPVLKLLAQRELQSDLKALKLAVEHKLS